MTAEPVPPDFDARWEAVAPVLAEALTKKNQKVWELVWQSKGNDAFTTGARSVSKTISSDMLAHEYFEKHGLELVTQLTETDIAVLRTQLQNNWGVGERKFAQIVHDSYVCSEERLKRIYRTEVHQADLHGAYGVAKKIKAKTKTWHSVGDERTYDTCLDMDSETAPNNEAFSNGLFISHSHPGCRCVATYSH